jgi:hypothetical protein
MALPSSRAYAGSSKTKTTTTSTTCGSNSSVPCNCPPEYTFIAYGTGPAIDDLVEDDASSSNNYQGCYDPSDSDDVKPNDTPGLKCPSDQGLGCGCILAGGSNPIPSDPAQGTPANIILAGDANFGTWKLTKLEINFAYLDDGLTAFTGLENGSGPGTIGNRTYGADGFAIIVATGGGNVSIGTEAYLLLQGTVSDSMPDPSGTTAQRFSFNGTYTVDPALSGFSSGTGNFVLSISDVATGPPAEYAPSSFSISGSLIP